MAANQVFSEVRVGFVSYPKCDFEEFISMGILVSIALQCLQIILKAFLAFGSIW